MKRSLPVFVGFTLAIGGLALLKPAFSDEKKKASEFASTIIDLGIVVSDVEASAKFYTEVVGFKEVPGFGVSGEFCKDAGLTDNHELKIRVFVLGEGEHATKIKLVQAVGAKIPKASTEYIESQTGFRYLTILVTDTNAALERLSKAGVKPLAKGPVGLPKGLPQGVFLTCVKDPDGNMVELVGPKK